MEFIKLLHFQDICHSKFDFSTTSRIQTSNDSNDSEPEAVRINVKRAKKKKKER